MIADCGYIFAAILLITGIKQMGKASSARQGNLISAIGMGIAIGVTLYAYPVPNPLWVSLTVLMGALLGFILSIKVQMTAMPELVALFNGFGGLASWAIGIVEGLKLMRPLPAEWFATRRTTIQIVQQFIANQLSWSQAPYSPALYFEQIAIVLAVIIGGITFTGSLIAYGKLSRKIPSTSITFPGQRAVDIILLIGLIAGSYRWLGPRSLTYAYGDTMGPFIGVIIWCLAAGVLWTLHIGGGDMPVIISLLNSLSGLAACAAGLISLNKVLIVAGCLVGTSGLILTLIMCKAMNRSILKVLLGGFKTTATKAQSSSNKTPKELSIEDAYYPIEAARTIGIVPGYGLAVSQAQHALKDFAQKLMDRGTEVFFAIHPVAGRMPGHMNVLLAEANVDYDQLIELEAANERFPNTDVVIVVGANDVVNSDAVDNPNSPLYGMPILEVAKAKTVLVLKRGSGSGYSGLENALFTKDSVRMIYGDAKKTLTKLNALFKV